jgi:hypothetical protein
MSFAQDVKPVAKPIPNKPAQTETLTPKTVPYGGSNIPGDAQVTIELDKLNQIQSEYQTQVKDLQSKMQPMADEISKKLNSAIDSVKKENGWGSDVSYDFKTKTWIRVKK